MQGERAQDLGPEELKEKSCRHSILCSSKCDFRQVPAQLWFPHFFWFITLLRGNVYTISCIHFKYISLMWFGSFNSPGKITKIKKENDSIPSPRFSCSLQSIPSLSSAPGYQHLTFWHHVLVHIPCKWGVCTCLLSVSVKIFKLIHITHVFWLF